MPPPFLRNLKQEPLVKKPAKEWGASSSIVQKIRASCFKEQALESEASGHGEMNVGKYPFVLSIGGILVTSAEAVPGMVWQRSSLEAREE